jgi:hypothetical protein
MGGWSCSKRIWLEVYFLGGVYVWEELQVVIASLQA